MFKRPRGNKDTEVIGMQRMTKRLKEDTDSRQPQRYGVHSEDYINVTFARKISNGSCSNFSARKISDSSCCNFSGRKISDSSQYSNFSVRKISNSSQYSNVSMLQEEPVEMAEAMEGSQERAELLHYNRLKLQHQQGNSKYEIKMMQCASQCDSDNSSIASETMTDMSSEADSQETGEREPDSQETREREHYNKLKVDLQNIKSNKKLLKGIQVLKQHSLFNGTTTSSALIQSRQRVAVTSAVPPQYKKEGHANRLHSVAQSALHKSRSAGDILEMGQEQFLHGLKADMPTTQPNLPHSQSVYNMETDTPSTRQSQFKSPLSQSVYNMETDSPSTHLSQFKPAHSHNTRAKKTSTHGSHLKLPQLKLSQSVSDLDQDNKPSTHQSKLLPHSQSVQNIEADAHQRLQLPHSQSVFNMQTSRPSSRRSPLRHTQVSPLTLNQQLHHCHNPNTEPAFLSKVISFSCTHEGREIHSASYDFTVNIPRGTIRKRKSVDFQVGVCTRGPFVFPRGYKLVSPVIMVTCPSLTKLRKPVEIVLSHCMDLVRQGEENVTFFRAKKRHCKGRPHTPDKYYMEATDSSSNHFQLHHQQGRLTSTELGFFCVMSREHTGSRRHTNYCIVPVVPTSLESTAWRVHYCVTYHLKAFIKELQDHYGPNWETLPPKPFQLETRVGTQNREKIKIHFQRALPESGWWFSLESESKIHTSDIDSWNSKWPKGSQKAPCFTLRVCGDHATSAAVAQVWFTGPGMSQDLTTEVNLPLKTTPTTSTTTSPVLDSLSSHSSTSLLGMGSELSSSEYDHLPSKEELDETHIQLTYHNGYIDFPTDEDLQIVACEIIRAVDSDWVKLKASLEIPHHVLVDILHQRTAQVQVFRFLKAWRQHSKDSSKAELARCLRSTDVRLHTAAALLLRN